MDNLEEMLQNLQNANRDIIELFEIILELKIDKIEFAGREHFNSINEYDFTLIKLNLFCNDKKIQIYIKMIKGGKIKESIFCFWSLLYEEYLKNKKEIYENKKVIIKQRKNSETDSNIVLTLDQSLDYCAEINLIKLRKIALKNKKIERWLNKLQIKSEEILFIGRILNI